MSVPVVCQTDDCYFVFVCVVWKFVSMPISQSRHVMRLLAMLLRFFLSLSSEWRQTLWCVGYFHFLRTSYRTIVEGVDFEMGFISHPNNRSFFGTSKRFHSEITETCTNGMFWKHVKTPFFMDSIHYDIKQWESWRILRQPYVGILSKSDNQSLTRLTGWSNVCTLRVRSEG